MLSTALPEAVVLRATTLAAIAHGLVGLAFGIKMDRDVIQALIIGTNRRAQGVADKLVKRPEEGYKVRHLWMKRAWSARDGTVIVKQSMGTESCVP